MAARPSKCIFFKENINFLGHIVSAEGSKPTEENIKAIRNFGRPRTVRQVRSFLGTINFYRKFIKNVTSIAAPLYKLLKKNQTKIQWTEECNKAFILLKEALVTAPVLSYPDFSLPFSISCDASDIAIGGVLEQEIDGDTHPIAFCSRKLNHAEQNYSVIEREALAIVYVLSQFRYLIFGYEVTLKTDHKPLSYLFQLKDTNQRLIRWMLHIQDYRLKFKHISGKNNYVADMLSRSDESSEILNFNALKQTRDAITNSKIKLAQSKDTYCIKIIKNINDGIYKNNEFILDDDLVLLKQVFPTRMYGWKYRVVVPSSLIKDLIFIYHDQVYSGHLSTPKVIWKIKQIFTWNTMFRDIANYIKTCEKCQRRNVSRTKAPFQAITPPSYPMQRLNVDLLGPFETTKERKNKYLIVYTDSMTRFVFASAIPNMEAVTVAQNYIDTVFTIHGGSQEILTDRGPQFMGSVFENLCKRLGIKHLVTSSYRPSCNGISERQNSKILNILAHVCNKHFNDWDLKLGYVLFAIRTSIHRSTGESPFFLLHAFDAIIPEIESSISYRETHETVSDFVEKTVSEIELMRAEVADKLLIASEENCRARNVGRKLNVFSVGDQVLYLDSASYSGKNRKLKPRFLGPYRIIMRLGIVNYRIRNLGNPKDVRTTHVDKIKHYFPRFVINDSEGVVKVRSKKHSNKTDLDCNMFEQDEDPDDEISFPIYRTLHGEGIDKNQNNTTEPNITQNDSEQIENGGLALNNDLTNLLDIPVGDESNTDIDGGLVDLCSTDPSPFLCPSAPEFVPAVPIPSEIIPTPGSTPIVSIENSDEVQGRYNSRYNLREKINRPGRFN